MLYQDDGAMTLTSSEDELFKVSIYIAGIRRKNQYLLLTEQSWEVF